MDLRSLTFQQIEILKEIRFHSSLRSVCAKLNINVSNISREIKAIEEAIEQDVISTSSRGYTLTEQGLYVSTLCQKIWEQGELLSAKSTPKSTFEKKSQYTIGGRGYLNLLASQNFSKNKALRETVRLRFLDISPNDTIQLAVVGLIEVMIHFEKFDLPSSWMTQTLVEEIPWRLHVPKNSSLSDKSTMDEILDHPFVGSISWNGRELATNEDGFPLPWGQRQKGFEAQNALMALQIVSNSDHVVFLPDLFGELLAKSNVRTIQCPALANISKPLNISVQSSKVSVRFFNEMLNSFKNNEGNSRGEIYENSDKTDDRFINNDLGLEI